MLLACQGQLRLAPSGHTIGIDMDAALRIGAGRGSDLAVLSELLPAAEAGLVEALRADEDRRHCILNSATNVRSSSYCGHCDARPILPSLTPSRTYQALATRSDMITHLLPEMSQWPATSAPNRPKMKS